MNKNQLLNIFERYLSGEANSSEIAKLRSFIVSNTQLSDWLENEIKTSSEDIDLETKLRMLENIQQQTNIYATHLSEDNSDKNKRGLIFRKISNIAAIILPFVLILGAYLYFNTQKAKPFVIAANLGEKASLILPEGTKANINSGSKILYYSNYNEKNRFIELEGEAFFDVMHDLDKPFIVQCEDIQIKVLGTSFGIKAYKNEEDISVVLNTGKIQLITPMEEIEMKPNERITYNKTTQKTTLYEVNAEDYTDWRQNRLRFEDESLSVIMKTISRMHNIDIVFENAESQNKRFTGTIDNSNIESVLNTIKLTSSVQYRQHEGVIYLY